MRPKSQQLIHVSHDREQDNRWIFIPASLPGGLDSAIITTCLLQLSPIARESHQ